MNDIAIKPPIWFWVVSTLGLVWNAMGVVAFVILLRPCDGNLFIHAVETWDSLARSEALPSPFVE